MVATMDPKLNEPHRDNSIRSILIAAGAGDAADSLRYNLEREGFRIWVANTTESALELVIARLPNLVLIDIGLIGTNGLELCGRLRAAATTRMPILVLTARSPESDQVLGLDLGADDYLTKPFAARELLGRVNAILRRNDEPEQATPLYDDGVLVIDPWAFSVRYEGREVRLTRKEMRLLEELARNEGRVMMREVLLDRIWGLRKYGDSRTLDVHIRRLRRKLGNPKLIETITGIGYRLIGSRSTHN
jgi:DNA-binding response OmpR family regulator